jgi:hypothetical protein
MSLGVKSLLTLNGNGARFLRFLLYPVFARPFIFYYASVGLKERDALPINAACLIA